MIMVGNTFHNFVDGIIIAAAFLADVHLGIVTALAIIAHEIPQEVGDFMILLHSGYTKAQALLLNLVSSLATLLGGVLAYYALRSDAKCRAGIIGFGRGEHDLRRGCRSDPRIAQAHHLARHARTGRADRAGHIFDRAGPIHGVRIS